MTLETHKDGRTLADIRATLEGIADECARTKSPGGRESVLLSDVVRRAEEARSAILDLSVAMSAYVTHCLERETEERGPSL